MQNQTAPKRPKGYVTPFGSARISILRQRSTSVRSRCQLSSKVAVAEGLDSEVIATPEWHSLSTGQHNAIFEGPEEATDDVLRLLQPYLRTPAIWNRAPMPLEFPAHGGGALVLRNVCALDRQEQAALLNWLEAGRKQVISTTTEPLFPLVAMGRFDEALYYRLNVMLVRIDSPDTPS